MRRNMYAASISGLVLVALVAGLSWSSLGGYHSTSEPHLHEHESESGAHDHDSVMHEGRTPEALTAAILDATREGKYKCCLETPCQSCFLRHEHEGTALLCDCLVEVVEGRAPCGECVGGILAGEGEPFLAEYFAVALSDRYGQSRRQEFVALVADLYGLPADAQYQ